MKLEKKTFLKGEIVLKEGERDRSMFYILKGSVSVVAKNPHRNKKSAVNELVKGDLIGELSFFDGLPRSATLIAKEDTEVLIIEKNFFDDLKKDHLRVIQALVNKIRKLNERIIVLNEERSDG